MSDLRAPSFLVSLCDCDYAFKIRGEQMNTRADPTNRFQRHRPDTNADQMSQGRHLEGKAHSDADAMQSPDQRRRN